MANDTERRTSRRFGMSLALTVRPTDGDGAAEQKGRTRDVGFRGLYFMTEADYEVGSEIEFILTLPKEVTQSNDVNIRCRGRVLRVDPYETNRGVAARIERYEFLPMNT
jgi:hypothetical protein